MERWQGRDMEFPQLWKVLQRTLALPVAERPQTGADFRRRLHAPRPHTGWARPVRWVSILRALCNENMQGLALMLGNAAIWTGHTCAYARRMAWAGQRRTGSPTQPTAPSFTKTRGPTGWIARPSRSRGPANWLGKANHPVRDAGDDTGRWMHDDGRGAVNDRLALTRVGASRAHLHAQASREPRNRDHSLAQVLPDSGPMAEDYADTIVRPVDSKGQPFRAAHSTLTQDDLVLLGLSA